MSVQSKLSYKFAGFLLDPAEQTLLRRENGEPVSLTPKAFLTLLVLLQNSGRTVEKEELLREVWPETFVEEGNLTVTIFMLRKSLGEERNEHKYIKTVPRRGYRFIAPVREVQTLAPPRPLERRTAHGAEERTSVAILPLPRGDGRPKPSPRCVSRANLTRSPCPSTSHASASTSKHGGGSVLSVNKKRRSPKASPFSIKSGSHFSFLSCIHVTAGLTKNFRQTSRQLTQLLINRNT